MLFVADSAKDKIESLLKKQDLSNDYFIRVSVVSGGCSGLTYKMDFDNEMKPNDQVFEDNGMKVICDTKSVLYLFNTTLVDVVKVSHYNFRDYIFPIYRMVDFRPQYI